jgi:hypothetical protein
LTLLKHLQDDEAEITEGRIASDTVWRMKSRWKKWPDTPLSVAIAESVRRRASRDGRKKRNRPISSREKP